MTENPYQPPSDAETLNDTSFTAQWAGVGARFLAYLIDILPITFAIFAINAQFDFLSQRGQIRDLSFIVYILYCVFTEGSAMQGTIGKRMLGLRVTDNSGRQLTIRRALGRNLAKIISYIPLGLGFIWAIWSNRKRGWHDMIANTLVIKP